VALCALAHGQAVFKSPLEENQRGIIIMNRTDIRDRYWLPLQAVHKAGATEALEAAYASPERGYHSWSHISDLLEALEQVSELAVRPDLITIAIFWHDAVYVTRGANQERRDDLSNVHDSAAMFSHYTLLDAPEAQAVEELIMATADHLETVASRERYPGFSKDLSLFVDLDLSTLAAPWSRFAENFDAIRSEFPWIPDTAFNAGQGAFLRHLLANEDKLFRRSETIRRWRSDAVTNIKRCLVNLETSGAVSG
jgi:predicted metal-dependent HD superfamily phosphohydrolase